MNVTTYRKTALVWNEVEAEFIVLNPKRQKVETYKNQINLVFWNKCTALDFIEVDDILFSVHFLKGMLSIICAFFMNFKAVHIGILF